MPSTKETAADMLLGVIAKDGVAAFELELRKLLATEQGICLGSLAIDMVGGGSDPWLSSMKAVGLDLNFKNETGDTILSACIHVMHSNIIFVRHAVSNAAEALSLGADPNGTYLGSCSITALAIGLDAPEIAALLLLAGADVDREEPEGNQTLRNILLAERPWGRHMLAICDATSQRHKR